MHNDGRVHTRHDVDVAQLQLLAEHWSLAHTNVDLVVGVEPVRLRVDDSPDLLGDHHLELHVTPYAVGLVLSGHALAVDLDLLHLAAALLAVVGQSGSETYF